LVHLPVEQLRGWATLSEKDQRRIRTLIAAGEGATFRSIAAAAAAAAAEAAEAAKAAKTSRLASANPSSSISKPLATSVTFTGSHIRFDDD
jgi:septal ring factor EnvC (AmiA/AmiB activator)